MQTSRTGRQRLAATVMVAAALAISQATAGADETRFNETGGNKGTHL